MEKEEDLVTKIWIVIKKQEVQSSPAWNTRTVFGLDGVPSAGDIYHNRIDIIEDYSIDSLLQKLKASHSPKGHRQGVADDVQRSS